MKQLFCTLALLTPAAGALAQPPLPPIRTPAGNPITPNKVLLGKALFFEEQLSSTNRMACATCHTFSAGGSDARTGNPDSRHPGLDNRYGTADDILGSMGIRNQNASGSYVPSGDFAYKVQVTNRRPMTVINAAFSRILMWDGAKTDVFRDPSSTNNIIFGRDAALETQAAGPVTNTVEMSHMGETWANVVMRLQNAEPLALASNVPTTLANFINNRSYQDLFTLAFGTAGITAARVSMAIATYERTLISDQTPWDSFLAGNQQALTQSQVNGLNIFRQRCDGCHAGRLTSNDQFTNTGVRPVAEDPGRQLITNDPRDRGQFRVPNLRNVALRAPYFHNGQMATLMDVVDFYNRGGDFNDNKDNRVRRLGLNATQRQDVVNFLQSLTDPRVLNETAPFDRPTLFTEGNQAPAIVGTGTAGTAGVVPQMTAVEPPFLGNPNFTIGMNNGMGGAPAVLLFDVDTAAAATRIGGANIHLPISAGLVVRPMGSLAGFGPGAGYTSISLTVPTDPNLVGAIIGTQWAVGDTGNGGQFSSTAAARITLF